MIFANEFNPAQLSSASAEKLFSHWSISPSMFVKIIPDGTVLILIGMEFILTSKPLWNIDMDFVDIEVMQFLQLTFAAYAAQPLHAIAIYIRINPDDTTVLLYLCSGGDEIHAL